MVVANDLVGGNAVVVERAVLRVKHVGVDAVGRLVMPRQELGVPQRLAAERRFGAKAALAVADAGHVHRGVVEPVAVVLVVAPAERSRKAAAGLPERDEALVEKQRPGPHRPLLERAVRQPHHGLLVPGELFLQDQLDGRLHPVGRAVDEDAIHLRLDEGRVVAHPAVEVVVPAVDEFRLSPPGILVGQPLRRGALARQREDPGAERRGRRFGGLQPVALHARLARLLPDGARHRREERRQEPRAKRSRRRVHLP